MNGLFNDDSLRFLYEGFNLMLDFAESTNLVDVTIDGEHFTLTVATGVLSLLVFRLIVAFICLPWAYWRGGASDD